jgi:hypothetical protein
MSAPIGDTPDWQLLTNPLITNISVHNQTGGFNNTLISSSVAFRIWGAWISAISATLAAYAGGGQYLEARLVLADSSILLSCSSNIAKASDHDNQANAIALNGFTPPNSGGFYTVNFVTDTPQTNNNIHGSCGLFYSIP